jgi:phosphoglycerol transferase MdoB-like AlkP superfamily enzyme
MKTIFQDKWKMREKRDYSRQIAFFNRYSLLFHALLACMLVFVIEVCSRRSLVDACVFLGSHSFAFFFNALIIFFTMSVVYLFRRRMLMRIIISCFWLLLGIINGCVLSQRVTPFGYTDLKCISDLLTMTNTQYFSKTQEICVIILLFALVVFLVIFALKGPKFQGHPHKVRAVCFCAGMGVLMSVATSMAHNSQQMASYFANIAQGYSDYGFVYGFSSSVMDRGMSKPSDYSESKIKEITQTVSQAKETASSYTVAESGEVVSDSASQDQPNVICVLLESFMDPTEINFLKMSKDPIPNFRALSDNFTSGYLTVPVVGAGTANSEFEVLTGMNLRFFGTGEYPYKTILKETDCESIASDLSAVGYGTHVVHNNGGNFYSRANAFSQFGFDTFTSKELMNIQEYTPLGSWPTDDILISETQKALDSTPDKSDFVYTITVQGHGSYPEEKILENPQIQVSGAETTEKNNQWEYYVNQIHEVDKFIKNLTDMLSKRDEKTLLVLFGDHLPTMGLADEDLKSGDIFKTQYATWNNFGLEQKDADLAAYQLLAYTTEQAGIHEGTIFTYHQAGAYDTENEQYQNKLENLQYDILYGERYCYDGINKYPASDLQMGVDKTHIYSYRKNADKSLSIYGDCFTNWSRIYVNDEKMPTTFVSDKQVVLPAEYAQELEDGDILKVCQVGSSNTIFRTTENAMMYYDM